MRVASKTVTPAARKVLSAACLLAAGAVTLATQSGCLVAAAAGGTAATVAYVRGDSEAFVGANPEAVTVAGKAALEEMKLTVLSSEASGVDGKVVARTARDVKVVVVAEAAGASSSKVTVRVGNFGDDLLQAQVLEKIKAKLATPDTAEQVADTAD